MNPNRVQPPHAETVPPATLAANVLGAGTLWWPVGTAQLFPALSTWGPLCKGGQGSKNMQSLNHAQGAGQGQACACGHCPGLTESLCVHCTLSLT